MNFDSGADDGEEMAGDVLEHGSISHGKVTHLPSLVNMGGCELVLESVSGDQRHRRGGSVVVVAGPCAMLCAACWGDWAAAALDALAFDLRAGIWPNGSPPTKNASATHSAFTGPNQEMFFLLFFP